MKYYVHFYMEDERPPLATFGPYDTYSAANDAAGVIWELADKRDESGVVFNDVSYAVLGFPDAPPTVEAGVEELVDELGLGFDDPNMPAVEVDLMPPANLLNLLLKKETDGKSNR